MKATQDVVIRLKNKATGVTYIYYGHSNYSKDGRCTTKGARKCIGKINAQDEFQPNGAFLAMPAEEQLATGLVETPYLPKVTSASFTGQSHIVKFYGCSAAIEAVAKSTGIYDALRFAFPDDYLVMMSCVQAMLCYPNKPLYSPRRFTSTCWHTNVDSYTEGQITSALESASVEENRDRFFARRGKGRDGNGPELVYAVDTTTLSTYSAMLSLARRGHNKEGDRLDQVKLLMVSDNESGVPVYYRTLAGNFSDMKTMRATLADFKALEVPKRSVLCADRAFCTNENMRATLQAGYLFLTCVPSSSSIYTEAVEDAVARIEDTSCYVESIKRYCVKREVEIPCTRRGRGKNSYTMATFTFRDLGGHAEDKEALTQKFAKGLASLNADPSLYKSGSWYSRFFIKVREGTRTRPPVFGHDRSAQDEAKDRCGLYVMIAPAQWTPDKVHTTYRHRDVIEKGFENWKSLMRRPRHSIDEHLEGKTFLVFLSVALKTALSSIMHDHLLDMDDSYEDVMDTIFCARWSKDKDKPFKQGRWVDLTKEQIMLLHTFGVPAMDKLLPNVDNLVEADKLHRQGKKARRGRKKKDVQRDPEAPQTAEEADV